MSDVNEFLAHYGVKGMKWGVRRGSLKTRFKDATTESNTQVINRLSRIRSGKNLTRVDKVIDITNRLTMGRKLTNKFYDRSIKSLENENARIAQGKLTAGEKLDIVMTTNVGSLLVKRNS